MKSKDLIPEDCMQVNQSIPPFDLGQIKEGMHMMIIIKDVYSLSNFWITRVGKEFDESLAEMQREMLNYYTVGEGEKRFLTYASVRVGHYVASKTGAEWFRAVIVKLVDEYRSVVHRIDNGDIDIHYNADLRQLPRKWSELPAQGIRAAIRALRPICNISQWTHASCEIFLELVRYINYHAHIVAIDVENRILQLSLYTMSEKSKKKKTFIAEKLKCEVESEKFRVGKRALLHQRVPHRLYKSDDECQFTSTEMVFMHEPGQLSNDFDDPNDDLILYPEDSMAFQQKIPPFPIHDLTENSKVYIEVCEIYSPSDFWIRILDNSNGDIQVTELDSITADMKYYYEHDEGILRQITNETACVGHCVATIYGGEWCRSMIVHIYDPDTYHVLHLDVGRLEVYSQSEIYILLHKWGELPVQAVQAQIDNITPYHGDLWSVSACDIFNFLLKPSNFFANISDINMEKNIVKLDISLDLKGDDNYVSSALVNSSYAILDEPTGADMWHKYSSMPRRLNMWNGDPVPKSLLVDVPPSPLNSIYIEDPICDNVVFPNDCMQHLQTLCPIKLQQLIFRSRFTVIIGEIISPSYFWIIVKNDDTSDFIKTMTEEMMNYYTENDEGRYRKLSPEAVRVGHYVVSYFKNRWRRSMIVEKMDEYYVNVRHVDYGTEEVYPITTLRHLLQKWSVLPAQAIRARLANIRPCGNTDSWLQSTCDYLRLTLINKFLDANIISLDENNVIVDIELFDINKNASINNKLVSDNHAELVE